MLTFKNTIYVFMVLLLALLAADSFFDFPGWYYLVPPIIFSFVLFYGSYFIDSGFYLPVTCHGNKENNQVALTFDDGPVAHKTEVILDTLKKNRVPAAFFCIGNRMENQPALVKRISDEGHLIGNHSYTHHFFFDLFTKAVMKDELDATNECTLKIIRKKPEFFRPPYGVTTPVLAKAIRECGMKPVGWSLRSLDTVTSDESKLVAKIGRNVKPGDIILLHDTAAVTVTALQKIIDVIRKKGLEPVRLDHLLKMNAYA